ncbi:protein max-like [Stegodyphus dumicola]|uniref:protein max-like n=1 Tax=Stegodyphus dumicola TaxID=202533 RepID=UPI0015B10720|nr:protein max-like [Stegodyphus dumicola]
MFVIIALKRENLKLRELKMNVDKASVSSDASCTDSSFEFESSGKKRTYHNILERKRRHHIKEGYLKLRNVIPEIAGKKVSRIQILKSAIEHIRLLREQIKMKENLARQLKIRIRFAKSGKSIRDNIF